MGWAETFIAVDWGTTNRRAWRVGAGSVEQEFEDNRGVLSVAKGEFPAAVAEIRERLGNHPMLMAGMIGSNRGWVEAPYVPCPAGLDAITASLAWAEASRTAIVPGLSNADPPDVMRGEEVQIFGAIEAGMIPADCLVCHPGTHNKWARLEAGRVTRFRTVMTGELFSLLREHSILADLLSGPAENDDAFARGVTRGLEEGCLTAELFKIRARVLLGQADAGDAASYGSGLLIGTDVRAGLQEGAEREIYVMGRPELTRLYAEGLRIAGKQCRQVDGEEAFLAGARKIVEILE